MLSAAGRNRLTPAPPTTPPLSRLPYRLFCFFLEVLSSQLSPSSPPSSSLPVLSFIIILPPFQLIPFLGRLPSTSHSHSFLTRLHGVRGSLTHSINPLGWWSLGVCAFRVECFVLESLEDYSGITGKAESRNMCGVTQK